MEIYTPSELMGANGEHTGKWHYTVKWGEHTVPHGYCAKGCPGHDTPEAAVKHYEQWLIEENLRLDGDMKDTQKKCEVCGEWTSKCALIIDSVWEREFVLCDAHRNRESIENLVSAKGSIWSD